MSKKVAIVSDSTSGLTVELMQEYNIHPSYLIIIFGTDSYQEFKEVDPAKFIELSKAQAELPTTSQSSPGVTVEIYENLLKEGYEEIVHLTISSGLSGSYQSAVSAAAMVDADKIHVFDTQVVAYPQGALAIEAAKMANDGRSAVEILAQLDILRNNLGLVAAIDDMTNLKKGGRVSAIQAGLGSVLQVKPILTMVDGSLAPLSKVRTFKKAIDFLVNAAVEANLDTTKDEIGVIHMENPEAAALIKEKVLVAYPGITVVELPLSLTVSVHAGPGATAIGWIKR